MNEKHVYAPYAPRMFLSYTVERDLTVWEKIKELVDKILAEIKLLIHATP